MNLNVGGTGRALNLSRRMKNIQVRYFEVMIHSYTKKYTEMKISGLQFSKEFLFNVYSY